MPRYIDADAIHYVEIGKGVEIALASDIDKIPTISPDEAWGVGKWEDAKQHGLCRCSVCKDCYIEKDYIAQTKWKYCPNCGAKMEVSEDTRKN